MTHVDFLFRELESGSLHRGQLRHMWRELDAWKIRHLQYLDDTKAEELRCVYDIYQLRAKQLNSELCIALKKYEVDLSNIRHQLSSELIKVGEKHKIRSSVLEEQTQSWKDGLSACEKRLAEEEQTPEPITREDADPTPRKARTVVYKKPKAVPLRRARSLAHKTAKRQTDKVRASARGEKLRVKTFQDGEPNNGDLDLGHSCRGFDVQHLPCGGTRIYRL